MERAATLRSATLAAVALASIALVTLTPSRSAAAIIQVGPGCSLANAIYAANIDLPVGGCLTGRGIDEIRVPDGSIGVLSRIDHADADGAGASGLPPIRSELTIRPAAGIAPITIVRLDSAPDFRIFQIEAGGRLTLERVIVRGGQLSGSSGQDRGGCIEARSGAVGLTLIEATIDQCGGYADGTAIYSRAALTRIWRSAITGSRVTGPDPSASSAVWMSGSAQLDDSTLADNEGMTFLQQGGVVRMTHCTLAGDAPAVVRAGLSATVQLQNTLLRGTTESDGTATFQLDGVNIIDPSLALEPLLDNGGPSPTRLPMNRGPAIDTAASAYCSMFDQRGVRRPQGSACDVGAVERVAPILETCGDGTVEAPEECDDGAMTASCDVDCTLAVCGDGLVNPLAGETCDDGVATRLCNADCTITRCGDRVVSASAGEDCDDGRETNSCDADCTIVECGDGVINVSAGEECEDGNQVDHDGCSRRCRAERDAGPRPDAGSRGWRDAGEAAPDAGTDEGGGCATGHGGGLSPLWALGLLALVRRRRARRAAL